MRLRSGRPGKGRGGRIEPAYGDGRDDNGRTTAKW